MEGRPIVGHTPTKSRILWKTRGHQQALALAFGLRKGSSREEAPSTHAPPPHYESENMKDQPSHSLRTHTAHMEHMLLCNPIMPLSQLRRKLRGKEALFIV